MPAPEASVIYTLDRLQKIYVNINIGKIVTSFLFACFFNQNTIPVTGIGVDLELVLDGDVSSRILLVPYLEEHLLNTASTLFFYELLTRFQA